VWQSNVMAGNRDVTAAGHFGRQMRKERLAHGWSLAEFSRRAGIDAGHLSRIETGKRPPTEVIALACDEAFPERRGWFSDWYAESRTWSEIPAGFRNWQEVEDKAATLRAWSPGIVHGLLQTEDYARTLISAQPAMTAEVVATRLSARMDRQRRVLMRDDPPSAWFVVDQLSLCRLVGSPAIMAAQLAHLSAMAALPNVTMQVIAPIAHPANNSGFIVADDNAWCEHVASGYVFHTEEIVSSLLRLFDSLRGECHRVSESAELICKVGERWATGGNPATAMAAAATA
jgi:transcriptional regulator with XRE-family HTH domain